MPSELAYVGVRTEPGPLFGRVIEIDPDGPAAGAGFRIGDLVGGLAPARSDAVMIGDAVTTRFRFGLTMVDLTDGPVSIWVHRGPEQAELKSRRA